MNQQEALQQLKPLLGQCKYERISSLIKVLESKGMKYSVRKLSKLSRKDILKMKMHALAINQVKISDVRDKQWKRKKF